MKSLFQGRRLSLLLTAVLVLITFGAYFGVWRNEFTDYDDQHYVFANRHVCSGLTWSTLTWAFTEFHAQNWHPLTWISHAMDVQIYGLNPAGHHVTNLIFHLLNTALVFVVLRRMTGSTWRSALVAALFGVHPLHVESVAWIAERKDVLSGFFFLLTLWAYGEYAIRHRDRENGRAGGEESLTSVETGNKDAAQARPHPRKGGGGRFLFYSLALVFFAVGLMSKPMLVTVPFVLLLLDWWPLDRFKADREFKSSLILLAKEKIPFFVLSVISSIVTMNAQSSAMPTTQQLPPSYRLTNALNSYWVYLKQTFWPADLTVFYPHVPIPASKVEMAAVILSLATLAALMYARRFRFLPTGWLWYLGMLVPVLGLVQVGSQAHADRYAYLPHIGLFIVIAWSMGALIGRLAWLRFFFGPVMVGVVGLLAVLCNQQVAVWRTTLSLFQHGAKVNPKDYLARSILAKHEIEIGKVAEATRELEAILQEAPGYPFSELLMAIALQKQGRMEEAVPHLLEIQAPDYLPARSARLAMSYMHVGELGKAEEAMTLLAEQVSQDPGVWLLQVALLKEKGEYDQAKEMFQTLVTNVPPSIADNPTLNFETAELYALIGEPKKALPFYDKAIEMLPTYTNALNNYAWLLATSPDAQTRNGKKAVQMAEKACELSQWKVPIMIGTLAAAYAEAGRFDDAVKTAEKARNIAKEQGLEDVARRNEELMRLYKDKKPYRETE